MRPIRVFFGGMSGAFAALLCVGFVVIIVLWSAGIWHQADSIAAEGVIIAVLFGIFALNAAREHQHSLSAALDKADKHEESLSSVAKNIEDVSKFALTKPIGSYPREYLPAITELVNNAQSSLRVLCDNPAYGIFSAGPEFDDYLCALRSKVIERARLESKLSVQLTFLGADERRELHQHQVGPGAHDHKKWEKWRDERIKDKRLPHFWQRTAKIFESDDRPLPPRKVMGPKLPPNLKFKDYVDRLAAVNDVIFTTLLRGATMVPLRIPDPAGTGTLARHNGPTVYFWLRDYVAKDPDSPQAHHQDDPDSAEAIFALVPLGDIEAHSREYAFSTRDPMIIKALVGIFERYR